MKKVMIMVLVVLGAISTTQAKKFDYGFINGLKPGLSKKAALEILDKNQFKYEIFNNTVGGKFYEVLCDSSIGGVKIITIRFAFENSKILSVALDLADNYGAIDKYLDKECNCMIYNELGNFTSYAFDNCTVNVREDGSISINNAITKCKE